MIRSAVAIIDNPMNVKTGESSTLYSGLKYTRAAILK